MCETPERNVLDQTKYVFVPSRHVRPLRSRPCPVVFLGEQRERLAKCQLSRLLRPPVTSLPLANIGWLLAQPTRPIDIALRFFEGAVALNYSARSYSVDVATLDTLAATQSHCVALRAGDRLGVFFLAQAVFPHLGDHRLRVAKLPITIRIQRTMTPPVASMILDDHMIQRGMISQDASARLQVADERTEDRGEHTVINPRPVNPFAPTRIDSRRFLLRRSVKPP